MSWTVKTRDCVRGPDQGNFTLRASAACHLLPPGWLLASQGLQLQIFSVLPGKGGFRSFWERLWRHPYLILTHGAMSLWQYWVEVRQHTQGLALCKSQLWLHEPAILQP